MPSSVDHWAERALGEHGVVARTGACRRAELVRSRCASLNAGAAVTDVERDVDELLAGGRVVPVPAAFSVGDAGPRLKARRGRFIPGGVAEPLYTTREIVEVQDRLKGIVQHDPGTVLLLSYRPGGRLAALDAISRVAGLDQSVTAVAPGRAAAASFESVTGIETAPFVGRQRGSPGDADLVVVAEAHGIGPWELASLVESSAAAGGRVVLFAPAAALETRFSAAAVLAPHAATFAPRALVRERQSAYWWREACRGNVWLLGKRGRPRRRRGVGSGGHARDLGTLASRGGAPDTRGA